jgi:hypothetical protein
VLVTRGLYGRVLFPMRKLCIVQQDEIGDAWLDAEADKSRRLSRQTRAAIWYMQPHQAGCGTRGEMLADGAVYVGFVKRRHLVMI